MQRRREPRWQQELEAHWLRSVAELQRIWPELHGERLDHDQADDELFAMGGPELNPAWAGYWLAREAR